MELTVGVADPDETAALRDFFRWLRNEEEPPGEVRLGAVPVPGAMSGGLDVIDLVLTHSTGLASLALAFAGWRRARRSPAAFTVTRASDGLSVTVEEGSEEAVRRLLQALAQEPSAEPATEPAAAPATEPVTEPPSDHGADPAPNPHAPRTPRPEDGATPEAR
ncbi:effector-associated constant component EACC1 [Streptomyces sp. NPDC001927]